MRVLLLVGLCACAVSGSPSGCGGEKEQTASSERSSITSPNWPKEYGEYLDCQWLITSADGLAIEVDFGTPFHLEAGISGICYDALTIYKGTTVSSGVLAELCGERVPSPIHQTASSFLVTLKTDYMTHYEGFQLNFWTKGNSTNPPVTTTPVTTAGPTTPSPCAEGEWHCSSGECIPSSSKCDGNADCSDGSDEDHCATGDCGQPVVAPHTDGRIVNGEEATPHSFPWMVSLKGATDLHYCGASLISPRWVLTAAHCAKIVFIGTFAGDVAVVGLHDRQNDKEEGVQTITIEAKFTIPSYDNPDRANDIALLKLKEPAVMGPTVMPPCLPELGDFGDASSFHPGMNCFLSGWGKHGPTENIPSDIYSQPWILRRAKLPLVDDATCSQVYLEGAGFNIQSTMQCAGGAGETSCNGDSGGPLVCEVDGRWYQVGIVSFGPSPCDAAIPAVYTRVAAYVDWITETVEANGGWE